MTTLSDYIIVSVLLFSIGVMGVVCRRNILVIFMSLELMLNACNLMFITFSRHFGKMDGQVITFFVIALAAAEVAIGLGIVMAIYRKRGSIDSQDMSFLKG